ncbi:MAG: MBL fold metallo-hydrolase, partial [Spirochaetales bacterium]|nr:MBL fold metallo-hydrolase [Spirochaetales bacterium]
MITYAVIGSGSDANAFYFSYKGMAVMIDDGFTLKELRRRAELLEIDLTCISAVFLTHVHGDHARGVGSLARAYGMPVYMHEKIDHEQFQVKKRISVIGVVPGEKYTVGDFSV